MAPVIAIMRPVRCPRGPAGVVTGFVSMLRPRS
jgi:hypothetical protein